MKSRETLLAAAGLLTLCAITAWSPRCADAQDNFYAGKTVTLLATTAPGGTGDLRVKAVAPFLKKHIPGNPTVLIEYMDGGGGRKGANHLFNSVRPDGLTIGAASGAIVGLAVMGEKGVSYDPDKFIYLGTPEHENHAVIYSRRDLGLDTLEKLRAAKGFASVDKLSVTFRMLRGGCSRIFSISATRSSLSATARRRWMWL